MKKNKLYVVIGIVFMAIGIAVVLWYQKSPEISDFKAYNETKRIESAKEYGDKVIGWLRVEGTNIDLPLLETTNDTDVLRMDYEFAWTNSMPDEKSNRPAFVSHNIRNVSPNPIVGDDTMTRFEQLMSFIYPDFIEKNQFIEYTNQKNETKLYRIYSVSLLEDDQSAAYSDTYTKEEQEQYIKQSKKDSLYEMNVDVSSDDLLLTLLTCTRFYGMDEHYSFRVDAREVRKNEKLTLNNVKKSKNYAKIEDRMKEGEKNEEL